MVRQSFIHVQYIPFRMGGVLFFSFSRSFRINESDHELILEYAAVFLWSLLLIFYSHCEQNWNFRLPKCAEYTEIKISNKVGYNKPNSFLLSPESCINQCEWSYSALPKYQRKQNFTWLIQITSQLVKDVLKEHSV